MMTTRDMRWNLAVLVKQSGWIDSFQVRAQVLDFNRLLRVFLRQGIEQPACLVYLTGTPEARGGAETAPQGQVVLVCFPVIASQDKFEVCGG